MVEIAEVMTMEVMRAVMVEVEVVLMAGRGWKQRLCASNFTLFLGRVSNQRCSRKLRLPVHEGMIQPGGYRWPEKKFQNRSIKCGIVPYDPAIPLLGNIPHRV